MRPLPPTGQGKADLKYSEDMVRNCLENHRLEILDLTCAVLAFPDVVASDPDDLKSAYANVVMSIVKALETPLGATNRAAYPLQAMPYASAGCSGQRHE